MIKEALQYIVESHQAEIKEINGDYYVVSSTGLFRRIPKRPPDISMRSRDSEGNHLHLETFQGLVDLLLHLFYGEQWRIMISEFGVSVLIDPGKKYSMDTMETAEIVTVRNSRNSAHDQQFTYIELLDWLDLHADWFQPEGAYDNIRSAMRVLKQVESSSLEMEDRGAYILVAENQVKGIEASGQKIPTRINVILPFGTTEFSFLHKFRLRLKDGTFYLNILNKDDIIGEFRRMATDFLRAQLGDDVCIIS